MTTRFAIIDPAAGISGDMLLGALIDAGVPARQVIDLPARLGYPDLPVTVSRVRRCGVMSTRVTVGELHDQRHQQPDGPAAHGPHHHPHAIAERLRRAAISESIRERAITAFQLLTRAEADVHGTTPDDVVLHEVGAADALVDIVGALEGFAFLGIEQVSVLPVAVGSGWVT
ncbi:MAG TPA: nickel insertion protein, partial [Gemmatimonadales bacterium]|nr:nickel insertion protein [Gemmatimonadales bacterium]